MEELEEFEYEEQEIDRDDEYIDEKVHEKILEEKNEYYEQLEKENKFVLIFNTATRKEYIVPNTDVYKVETYENGKLIAKCYGKK